MSPHWPNPILRKPTEVVYCEVLSDAEEGVEVTEFDKTRLRTSRGSVGRSPNSEAIFSFRAASSNG